MKVKSLIVFIVVILLIFVSNINVSAFEPYQNYTYSFNMTAQTEPQAYIPKLVVTGENLGIGSFKNPQDLFVAQDEKIYIADTDNNRIVVLSKDFVIIKIISKFNNNGEEGNFNKPSGVFVSNKNKIYIADTLNNRIVVLDYEGNLLNIYLKPNSLLFDEKDEYLPIKIAVDTYERLYIVSSGSTSGLVQLDSKGEFLGYFGPIKVQGGLSQLLKILYTKEQRDRVNKTIPTIYSNISIDNKNFLYATVSETSDVNAFVRKLNPMGVDVLKRGEQAKPIGDGKMVDKSDYSTKSSQFIDVIARDYMVYSTLDSFKNRIFTYDYYGNLLYIFGCEADTLGGFKQPIAIDVIEDTTYLVLDSGYNQLVIFKPTDYGHMINQAIKYQAERNFPESEKEWINVLKYSSKIDIAYIGAGKAEYKKQDFDDAMKLFKLGESRGDYSRAFDESRTLFVRKYFGLVMTIILLAVLLLIIFKFYKKYKYRKGN